MRLPSQSLTMVLMLVTSIIRVYFQYRYDTQDQMWALVAFLACLFLTVSLSALYATYKGRTPLWGLLGIPGILGVLILWFLPAASGPFPPAKPNPGKSPNPRA